MTVLVLHRSALVPNPYHQWLSDAAEPIVLLASAERLRLHREALPAHPAYQHVEVIADYDDSPEVEERARELAARFGVRQILACQEPDLERAARLREALGFPGPYPAQVAQFRDKWEMKRRARAAGIPVAQHKLLSDQHVLPEFARAHGLPVVVKPRRGHGSTDVRILPDWHAVTTLAAEPARTAGGEPACLVESYVPGALHHIDGLILDGRVLTMWPFEYLFTPASFGTDRDARLDVALDAADPRTAPLMDFAARTLDALAPAPQDFAFHIEVFQTPGGTFVLGEAACRAPGAALREAHRAMFGMDPAAVAVRAQLGLPTVDAFAGPRRPRQLAGEMLLMKQPGTVTRLPAGAEGFPGVRWHRVFAMAGERLEVPEFCADVLAAFVVGADTRAECERRMRELGTWFRSGLTIEDGPDQREPLPAQLAG
jgi:biotin carboxylase